MLSSMLVLENNVSKWMDELHNGEVITGTSIRKTLYTQYTQGLQRNKWSTDGIVRFIEGLGLGLGLALTLVPMPLVSM